MILFICISIVSCSRGREGQTETVPAVSFQPTPSPSPSPELAISTAYPLPVSTEAPDGADTTAYPEPLPQSAEDYQVTLDCSPDSESGAIKGELHLQDNGPSAGSILYLAEYTGLETTNPIVVLNPARHIHVTTNQEGKFCFSEVPPGTYSLIVWNAADSILLKDPSTDHSLQLEVEAGEMLETGVLYTPHP